MMNGLSFSSGCESGWTIYLQQSNLYDIHAHSHPTPLTTTCQYDEEDYDSSMLSDASSGPPHFLNQEQYDHDLQNHIHSAPRNPDQKTNKFRTREVQQQLCLLDDTATSPLSNFSTNNSALLGNNQDEILDFSQAHSSTHFKEHYTLFQPSFCFCKPTATKPNSWFELSGVDEMK